MAVAPSRPLGANRTWPVRVAAFDAAASLTALPSDAWSARLAWSTWRGGRTRKATVARVDGNWSDFCTLLAKTANEIHDKGRGPTVSAPSTDGRRLDTDERTSCAGVHFLALDVDGAGDWTTLLAALDRTGVSYAAQRSSSHTPESPKWHLYLPVSSPVMTTSKMAWRVRYAAALGALERLAAFAGPLAGGAHGRGFDPCPDSRMSLSYLGARRTAESAPPETRFRTTERALDLDALLASVGFDETESIALVSPPARASTPKSRTDTVRDAGPAPATLPALAIAFHAAGWLGAWHRSGWRARCPFHGEHTDRAGEWDAAIFASGVWYCCHRACRGRRQRDVRAALPTEQLAPLEREREQAHESRALVRLREQLDAANGSPPVALAEVERLVASEITRAALAASALEEAARGEVVLARATTGSGKTRGAVSAAVSAPELPFLAWVRSTALAVELKARVEAARTRSVQRRFGVAGAEDDEGIPLCQIPHVARPLAAAGLSVPELLCRRCPHAPANGGMCQAYGGADGSTSERSPAIVGPLGFARLFLETARNLASKGRVATLVVDEAPPAIESATLTATALDDARSSLSVAAERDGTLLPTFAAAADVAFEVAASGLDALRATDGLPAARALTAALIELGSDAAFIARLDAALLANGRSPHSVVSVDAEGRAVPADAATLTSRLRELLPTLRVTGLAETAANELRRPHGADLASRLETVHRALRPVVGWLEGQPVRWEGGHGRLTVAAWSPEVEALLAAPAAVVFLDATPDLALLERACERAGRPLRVLTLEVADASPVSRVILYTPRANRRALLERSRPRWDVLGPRLLRALERLALEEQRTGRRIAWTLLGTILPLASAVSVMTTDGRVLSPDRVEHAGARDLIRSWLADGRRIDVAHFGAVEGLDRWRTADACLTLCDPFPSLDGSSAEAELLGLDEQGADARYRERTAAHLAQMHGRLRAPSRTAPAFMLHVGSVAPLGWRSGSTLVEPLEGGRPRATVAAMTAQELTEAVERVGGLRVLARDASVPLASLSRYVSGNRVTPGDAAARIRRALRRFEW